jgi:nicotinamidase-related amidase
VRAAALLWRARAAGALVVHVRHLPPGGAGAETPTTAVPSGWETVLDSPDPDPFLATRLDEELASRGVEAVVVAGPMSLACCDAAAGQALARRFRTLVADDATDAREEGALERARLLAARSRTGVEVLSAASIAALMETAAA